MGFPKLISIVIPVYNEEKNIKPLFKQLSSALAEVSNYSFEIIFVNDGSSDQSIGELNALALEDSRVRVIDFSRNFGKEVATTAGINHSRGSACIMMDGDLQHPIEKIPEFIGKWERGAEVVIGVREKNQEEGLVKKVGSYFFYAVMNRISDMEIVSRATDFRLMDRVVIDQFNKLSEKNRMTRALIDWLGFKREFIYFTANPRRYGKAGYSFFKLVRLAFNSMVSFSLFPLRLAGYLGIFITLVSGLLGIFIILGHFILKTTVYSGSAMLAVMILFLIGIVLVCLGLIALYIANIHAEVANRPLYIIRENKNKNEKGNS